MARAARETYLSVLPDMGTSFLKHKMVFTPNKEQQCQNSGCDTFALSVYSSMHWQLALQLF
jgi:hypothetical protein